MPVLGQFMVLMTRLVSCCDGEEDMNVVREQMREEVQWLKQATAVTEEADQVRREASGSWSWAVVMEREECFGCTCRFKNLRKYPNFTLISRHNCGDENVT